MNIDLSKYELKHPTSIRKIKKEITMYDINVKNDHTFHIFLDENTKILTHNCDGHHISALLLNFFHKWFPDIIKNKKLYRLITPLIGCNIGKTRKYFYTLEEYNNFLKDNKVTNVAYLKGLGSLSLEDWKYVMENKILFQIIMDSESGKYLEIAFGDSSAKRKKWLEIG